VIAVLQQNYRNIAALEPLGEREARLPWHSIVADVQLIFEPSARRGCFSPRTRGCARFYGITGSEMETLSQIALVGEVQYSWDFIFILNTIRHALGGQ
jgi:hypothetical protein